MKRLLLIVNLLLLESALLLSHPNQTIALFSQQAPLTAENLQGTYDYSERIAIYDSKPLASIDKQNDTTSQVLGETNIAKRIEINLSSQRLLAIEGDNTTVYDFPISSGKWGQTPTGTFKIWIKLKYTLMKGGSKALGTYYYLPNVPYTMFFYNDEIPKWRGYGIHGAYWHNNFGQPMSHGCINLKPDDAKTIFNWTHNLDIPVVIYGTAPSV